MKMKRRIGKIHVSRKEARGESSFGATLPKEQPEA
jgi:hypothetical protein